MTFIWSYAGLVLNKISYKALSSKIELKVHLLNVSQLEHILVKTPKVN